MTFAINPLEALVLAAWVVGILYAVRSLSKITSARLRVLLVLVALVPVAGSVVAVLLYAMFRFRELGHPESTQQGGG